MQKEFAQVFAGTTDFYGNFQPHYLDTIDMARLCLAADPQVTSYKLELVAERLGIELDDAHDADADVTATREVAALCSRRLRQNGDTDVSQQRTPKTRDHSKSEAMEEKKDDKIERVTFRVEDRMTYGVLNYDGNELMAAITGYDLNVVFNMRLINSLADAEACADALADVFYQTLMEQLISRKADFIQPPKL